MREGGFVPQQLLRKDELDEDNNSRTPLFWAEEGSKSGPRRPRDTYKAVLESISSAYGYWTFDGCRLDLD
jgi:hypothetical protein